MGPEDSDRFPRLKKVLAGLGEKDLDVVSLYEIQVGALSLRYGKDYAARLTARLKEARSDTKSGRHKDDSEASSLYKNLTEAVKKNKNIFQFRESGKKWPEAALMSGLIGNVTWTFGEPFFCTVRIPRESQRLTWFRPLETDESTEKDEEFQICSTGSVFMAYNPLRDYPSHSHIGAEYRMLLDGQKLSPLDVSIDTIGPCPIHPSFYLVLEKTHEQDTNTKKMRVIHNSNDVFVIVDSASYDLESAVLRMIRIMFLAIEEFYSKMELRNQSSDLHRSTLKGFSQLTKLLQELNKIPWWHVLKTGARADDGKDELMTTLVTYSDFELSRLFVLDGLEEYKNRYQSNLLISPILDYLLEHAGELLPIPPSFCDITSQFSEEFRNIDKRRTAIVSTIIGASGAALTALILAFL